MNLPSLILYLPDQEKLHEIPGDEALDKLLPDFSVVLSAFGA
jgi:hypothetical protein